MPKGFFLQTQCCTPGGGSSAPGSGGSGASTSASYVTITAEPGLSQERFLSASTGLLLADGGAGAALAVRINEAVVATLTGSAFSGPVIAAGGLTGSLQQLDSGASYLVAGPGIAVASGASGQVTVSSTGAADPGAAYLVLAPTASLANERALVGGTGVLLADGGPGTGLTASVDNNVVATVSGSRFTGAVTFAAGLTGSLTNLADGTPYVRAGRGMTTTTGSNGSVTVSVSASLALVDGQVEEHYALDVGIKNAGVSSTSNNNMAALGYLSTGGTDGQWRFNANPPSGYLGGNAVFRSYFSLTGSGVVADHAQFSVGVASFNIGNSLGSFTNFNTQVELGAVSSDTMQAFDVVLPQTFFTGSKSVLLFNLTRNRFATPGQDTYDGTVFVHSVSLIYSGVGVG